MSPPPRVSPALAARLHVESGAARWGLPSEAFQDALERSLARAFADQGSVDAAEIERYLSGLRLQDLALATACMAGLDAAWNHFVIEHRPALYRSADAIDPSGGARELADSLYADLFGLGEREGARGSLFRYFHGRSSLSTWLHAVLAQRHIDRVRTYSRLTPLPDADMPLPAVPNAEEAHPERARFSRAMGVALNDAIAALAPRDRLRLSCYYAQNLKLAAIGRLLGEHEATVSRHLARTRRVIREAVEQHLREVERFNEAAIAECFASVLEDAGPLDLADLIGVSNERKNDDANRSQR